MEEGAALPMADATRAVRERATSAADVAADVIRRYPVQALLGGLALGFLVARWQGRNL